VLAAACGDDEGSTATETTSGSGATGGLDLTVGSGAGGSGATGNGGAAAGCDGALAGGDPVWSASYGSNAVVFGVDVHSSGSVAVVGSYTGTLEIGGTTLTATGGDVFVALFDASGAPQWAKSFGGAMDQSGRGVAFDAAGDVVLVGQFRGSIDFGGGNLTSLGCCFEDFFVAKLDAGGNYLWQKQLGDDDIDRVKDMVVTPAGEIVITGQYQDELSLGGAVTLPATTAGDLNAFVAKLDATGNGVWGVGFGDEVDQDGHAVAIDGQGNVLVTGQFAGSIDIGTGALASAGEVSAFVAKLSSSGDPQWARAYGDGNAVGEAIGADSAGNVVVGGLFRGEIDFGNGPITSNQSDDVFVLSFDPTGALSAFDVYGTDSAQTVDGIAVSAGGEAVVVGSFAGTIDFGAGPLTADGAVDAYVAKLRTDLCPAFHHAFGGTGEQVARNVALSATGEAIVVGQFDTAIDIAGESLTAAGDDIFVVKLDP
jgi:hypothetical protein